MSKSAIVVVSSGGGVGSSVTGRLTGTVVIEFACGVNVWLRATGKQHASFGRPGVAVFSYSARITTTCIGPVVAPTATRTWVTVPVPGGSSEMFAPPAADTSPGDGTWIQIQDVARLGGPAGEYTGCRPRNGE